jgi:hypothetical protein
MPEVRTRRVREPHGDGQAAFEACAGGESGVVRSGDGVDDGEGLPAGDTALALGQALVAILAVLVIGGEY